MITEYAQLLSTAHRVLDGQQITYYQLDANLKLRKCKAWLHPDDKIVGDTLYWEYYKAFNPKHPSCVWVMQSHINYNWLYLLFTVLHQEYTMRYSKQHNAFTANYSKLHKKPINIPKCDATPLLCAMPEDCKISDDPVKNYREYYRRYKTHIHSWKNRSKPDWIEA